MPPRPDLAADTSAAAWLQEKLPADCEFKAGDWIPRDLPAIARIPGIEGGFPFGPEHRSLVDALSAHTTTPEKCCFALWEGYGWLPGDVMVAAIGRDPDASPIRPSSGLSSEAVRRARFERPDRGYVLFEGPLSSVWELGWREGEVLAREYPELGVPPEQVDAQVPDLMWPADRSWFFATDTDFEWAYIGGSDELIEGLEATVSGVTRVRREEPVG